MVVPMVPPTSTTPEVLRSEPRPVEVIPTRLPETRSAEPPLTSTPVMLPEITLRVAAVAPPTVVPAPTTSAPTELPPPTWTNPAASVPRNTPLNWSPPAPAVSAIPAPEENPLIASPWIVTAVVPIVNPSALGMLPPFNSRLIFAFEPSDSVFCDEPGSL